MSIQLAYDSLPGVVSAAALAEHVKLAEQYARLQDESDYNLAGAVMHELYFSGLSPEPPLVVLPALSGVIANKWGTRDAWWREMRAAAMASRGWAVLAARGTDLRILRMDKHDDGVLGYEPLIVVDCYDHAYADFGMTMVAKGSYLDALLACIDWRVAEGRWARLRHVVEE